MLKISKQDYDYSKMKDTLNSVSKTVNENLKDLGESVKNSGILDTVKGWFSGIGDWFAGLTKNSKDENLGILENTNDSLLGENAHIDATNKDAINLPSSEQVEGFFNKIWHWFIGFFNTNSNESQNNNSINESNSSNESTNQSNESNSTEINNNENLNSQQQSN